MSEDKDPLARTCSNCGKDYYVGWGGKCKACAYEEWDNGFQSTSEHAYQLGHRELNEKLDNPPADDFERIIRDIESDWDTQEWFCTKCEFVRIGPDNRLSVDDRVEELLKPCPKCGATGHLWHVVKGSYFS